MPTIEDRIATAKARAVAYKKRLEEHSLTTKLQEAEARAKKLESDRGKQAANRKRIDDKHAKIVLGAAVLLLSPARFFQLMVELIAVLKARDRKWIQDWCARRNSSLDETKGATEPAPDPKTINEPEPKGEAPGADGFETVSQAALSADQQPLQSLVPEAAREGTHDLSSSNPKLPEEMSCQDTVGEALKRAISELNEGDISIFSPEIIKNANEDDRKVLEAWFASLTQRPTPATEGTKSPDAEGRASSGEAVQSRESTGLAPAAKGLQAPDADDRGPAPETVQLQDAGDRANDGEGAESPGSHPQ